MAVENCAITFIIDTKLKCATIKYFCHPKGFSVNSLTPFSPYENSEKSRGHPQLATCYFASRNTRTQTYRVFCNNCAFRRTPKESFGWLGKHEIIVKNFCIVC